VNRSFWGYAWPWAGLAPFFSRTRFFEAGEVRLAILSLVSEGPKHGYQLMKELQDRSGGMYRASAGSVYPTLKQLEDEGLIAETKENGRRIFSLTAAGRKELESDPEGVRRIWERAEQCEDWGQFMGPETATLLPSMAGFMKACFRAAGRGRGERVRSILDRTRREVEDL
jgi:DNA-binding PadR family transcriptional regulator